MFEIRPLVSAVTSAVTESVALPVTSDSGFSPLALFRRGEKGFFNDIQTWPTSYFEDTAGTDPAELEDTIALVLDQSQGLVLGPELFSDFTTEGEWVDNGNGSWTVTSATATTDMRVDYSGTVGKRYEISYSISTTAALNIFNLNNAPSAPPTGDYVRRQISNTSFFIVRAAAGTTATISNISIRELPGNHLTQAIAGARPKLSARYNQITGSDGFTGAAITPATGLVVVATGLLDPRGGNIARQIRNTTTTEFHRLFYPFSTLSGRIDYSVEVKNVDAGFVQLSCGGVVVPAFGATFNLTAKTYTLIGATLPTADIEEIENGFLRLSLFAPANETGAINVQLHVLESNVVTINPNNTTGTEKSVIIAGADLRLASDTDQPAYQRVTTATDYDSEGFDPYLQFDQVDDALTATIPAITGGTLVLATRNGIWIDDDINASAGTFSIGPTTYTGGPVGLFSNTGSKLIGPPLLIDRQLTSSELNGMIQFYKNRGAGDVFLVDFGLIFDRAGSSILDRNDDPIRVRAA